jgi:hypothetical protein
MEGSDQMSMFNNWGLFLLSVNADPDLVVIRKRAGQ